MAERALPALPLLALLAFAGGAAAAEKTSLAVSSAVLTCEYLEYSSSDSVITARGDAVLVSSGTRLEADEVVLDMEGRTARARGRVRLRDESGVTLLAEGADFDWEGSTGVFTNGFFEDPPYRLWARRIVRVSTDTYLMEHAAVTSCELDPPHYHVRIASMKYVPKKHASVWWPRLALGDDSVIGLPYYNKTFRKKPWTLTVDPGRSSYHGFITKSIFSYKLTEHGTARAYWDHFHRTGEGFGGEYTYAAQEARGSVYGYRTDDRVSGTSRWNARLAHWQQIRPRLSLELNALAQSDAGFNNLFFRDDLYRVRTEAQSAGALSYQHPAYTTRFGIRHDRVFDPARGSFVTARTVAPELSFQGAPWRVGRDTYFTLALSARHQYDRPSASTLSLDPLVPEKDRFRWTGDGSMNLRRSLRLGRRLTLEPSAGASAVWESWRDLGTTRDPHAFVQGRGFTRVNLRHRLSRSLDQDLAHVYQVRWSPNQLKRDHAALTDQGLEIHQLTWLGSYRGRRTWARLSTGYDLRDPADQPLHPKQKILPPALDLTWRPVKSMSFFYREIYNLHPAMHPQSSQFSWSAGRPDGFQISSGYSYNGGLPGEVQFRHGFIAQITKGWHAEANVRYAARGQGGLSFDHVPKDRIEQEYVLRRDLHCWSSRITSGNGPASPRPSSGWI